MDLQQYKVVMQDFIQGFGTIKIYKRQTRSEKKNRKKRVIPHFSMSMTYWPRIGCQNLANALEAQSQPYSP